MKKSHIIAVAAVLYLLIMVIGVAAYFAYETEHAKVEKARQAAQTMTETAPAAKKQEKEPEEKVDPALIQAAAAKKAAEKKKQDLKGGMHSETINGVTYYKHTWPKKLAPGVYLRPFVAEGQGGCLLKNDVYYFYTIHDAEQTAWVMGDHLDIAAGGQTTTLSFDPSTMHKHMASDAEWLSENYVVNADKKTVAAFKRIAQSKQGSIVYYNSSTGKARRHELSIEEVTRISEMVELYELLQQDQQ